MTGISDLSEIQWTFSSGDERHPWFYAPVFPDPFLIKQNSRRKIWRIPGEGGTIFVKADLPVRFFDRMKMLFLTPPEYKEFQTFLRFERLHVPSCRYLAFGRCGLAAFLVSEELNGFLPANEFWFRIASTQPDLRTKFLRNTALLTAMLLKNRIVHSDFHSGNLMVHEKTAEVALIDLCGISFKMNKLAGRDTACDLQIFTDFSGELTEDEYREISRISGLEVPDPIAFWKTLLAEKKARIRRTFPKRIRQIKSGNSKFCWTEILPDGSQLCRRNTLWYAKQNIPVKELTSVEYPAEKAEQIWIRSFLDDLLMVRHPEKEIPLAIRRNGEKSQLFMKRS